MVGIPLKGTVVKIVAAGVIIGGAVYAADKLNLGTKVAFGANELGLAAGNTITQPIAGLTSALTKGIEDIRLNTQGLFDGLGKAGADVQEAFTGNRDAIEDFFGGGERPEFRADNSLGSSLEDVSKSVAETFQRASSRSVSRVAENSDNFDSFLSNIAQAVNPEKDTPTSGFYTITYKSNGFKTGALALSDAAVKQHREVGNTVTRVA